MIPPTGHRSQTDLFDQSPQPASPQDLRIAPQGAAPLGKEQTTFNRLLRQVESLRGKLAEWAACEQRCHQRAVTELAPVQQQLVQARRDLIILLGEILAGNAGGPLSGKVERKRLVRYLLALSSVHLEEDPDDAEVIARHDQYADMSFAEDQAFGREIARDAMQNIFGVDLEDDELAEGTMEDILAAGMARMQQQAEQEERAWRQARSTKGKQGSKAQQREADKAAAAEQAAQEVSQSVREVYRKLVSALHPDRAEDEADAARRHEFMQRVNQAYDQGDLLTLLTVQLETEQIDAEHLARVSKERLTHYNQVLREQLRELELELAATTHRFRLQQDDFYRSVTPASVERGLSDTITTAKEVVQALRENRTIMLQAKMRQDWLKEYAQAQREDEGMDAMLQDFMDSGDSVFDDGMFGAKFPSQPRKASARRARKRRR